MEAFIKNLARGAGKIARSGFRSNFKATEKTGFWDVVTKYDLAIDKFVVERIKKKFPTHGILTEESGQVKKAKRFWILDPIDGTANFNRGIANFCTAISFVENDVIKFGAIYEPITDELFFAKAKEGAFLNGKKIRVRNYGELFKASIAIELFVDDNPYSSYRNLLKAEILPPIGLHSGVLHCAYLSAGRFDGLLQKGGKPWDLSAGGLIMKEAGAKVTDFKGKPYRWDFKEILAANPVLHKKIMAALK